MHLRPSVGTVPLWDRPLTQSLWIVLPNPYGLFSVFFCLDCNGELKQSSLVTQSRWIVLPNPYGLFVATVSAGTLWHLCLPYGRQHNHPMADVSGAPDPRGGLNLTSSRPGGRVTGHGGGLNLTSSIPDPRGTCQSRNPTPG